MEKKKNGEYAVSELSNESGVRGRSRRKGGPVAAGKGGSGVAGKGGAGIVEKGEAVASGRKRPHLAAILVIALILIAGAGGGYYFAQAHTYREAFLPNTKINGIDASKKTIEEVEAAIEAELSGYELKVLGRNGYEEVITKEEIGLHSEFDGSLEEVMEAQEPLKWMMALNSPAEHEIGTMIVYDEASLDARIASLECMDPAQMAEPQDARLSEYRSETRSYEIIPAVEGTMLVEENVKNAIADAVMNLQTEVDLDAAECYTKPSVATDDESLQTLAAQINSYVGAVVNHTFGSTKEVLDGDTIHQWLTINGEQVTLDESQVTAYVRSLAKKYNTAYGKKKVKTSYGKTVTISGPYGWRMNEAKEAAAVLEIIKNGEQQTREPEYLQRGASHGEYDYGDTYVEVNLTAQHLFFYKDGKLVVETDFVSGNASKGWATPDGAYPLTYKERNATLNGENYETPVSYWMPFNGNIGLHDANWRSSFGGNIYKTNGSHGCINLPPKAAKLIYENISAGDPVLCYHLDDTESTVASKPETAETADATTAQETTTVPTTTAPVTEAPTTVAPADASPETTDAASTPAASERVTTSETEAPNPTSGPSAGTITPETGNTSGPANQPVPGTVTEAPEGQGTQSPGVPSGDYSGGPGAPGAPETPTESDHSGGPGAPGN